MQLSQKVLKWFRFFLQKLLIAFIIVLVLNPNEWISAAEQICGSFVVAAVPHMSPDKHPTVRKVSWKVLQRSSSLVWDLRQPQALYGAAIHLKLNSSWHRRSRSSRNVFPAICQRGRSSTSHSTESFSTLGLAITHHGFTGEKQSKYNVQSCRKPLQMSKDPSENRSAGVFGEDKIWLQRRAEFYEPCGAENKAILAISWMNSSVLKLER